MEIRFSIDDGSKLDTRSAALLEKYGFKGIFYIAPNTLQLTTRELMDIAERHEIGGHTLNHQRLTECSLETAEFEIYKGKQYLESLIGQRVTKFATPRGWQNDEVVQLIKNCRFVENRNTKMGITNITGYDKFWLPCSAHLYPRPEYNGDIYNGVIEKFNEAYNGGGYFNLLMHSFEIEKFGLWRELEHILKQINASISTGN